MSGGPHKAARTSPQSQVHELLDQIRCGINIIPSAKMREELNSATDSIEVLMPLCGGLTAEQDEWPGLDLTKSQARLLGAMRGKLGHTFTKDDLMNALYFDRPDEPEPKIVDVFICKLRKKLIGTGWEIKTTFGTGYRLERTESPALEALKAA
jgi:DNA-binding response OmpR family regulator